MNITDHVTSLKLSLHLKDLGFKQKSFYSWGLLNGEWRLTFDENCTETASAFILTEIINMLSGSFNERLHLISRDYDSCVSWNLPIFKDDNACDIAAKGLLYHLVTDPISLVEINARIC